MKLENQVCSLALAKRLKELGVKQESLFWWNQNEICWSQPSEAYNGQYWSAFTVAELGELLPPSYSSIRDPEWQACGRTKEIRRMNARSETEADVRAKMLIFLIENGV